MTLYEEKLFLGQYGSDLITDTGNHTPPAGQPWCAIDVMVNSVFHILGCSTLFVNGQPGVVFDLGEGESVRNAFELSLPAGTYYGNFTFIALSSGKVMAYRGRPQTTPVPQVLN